MKNVLIIASLYGSKRVVGLAKYLPDFGWSPTIITPPVSWQPNLISGRVPTLDGVRIIETSYGGIKESLLRTGLSLSKIPNRTLSKILRFGGAIVNYPDSYSDWHRFALRAGREVLDKGSMDAIMSICPITSHIVASQLKREYGLPWICDFPDLWSQNHVYVYGRLRRKLDTRLELKTLDNVDILTTSSEPRSIRQKRLHVNKRVETITLGYDQQEYDAKDIRLTDKFTITHTGSVYDNHHQSTSMLLVALDNLIRQGKIDRRDCEIHYYGNHLSCIDKILQNLKLQDIVHQHGAIPHNDVACIQMMSQVLLIMDWDDPSELGAMPGKIFEYLGARRPILATGGVKGNVVNKLIQETGSGYQAIDVGEAERVLLKCYQEWKRTGSVEYHGVGQERFTQREMARKYVELLNE